MTCQTLLPANRSYAKGDRIAMASNILLAIAGIASNGVLLHSIVKLGLSRKSTFMFCAWMCIADLLTSLTLQPLTAYASTIDEATCTVYDVVIQCMAHGYCEFSGLMIALMGMERNRQMRSHQNAHQPLNIKTAQRLIIIALSLCIFLVLISALSSYYLFLFELQTALSIFNFIILITVVSSYIAGIYSLKRAIVDINSQLTARVSRMAILVTTILVLSYVPILITYPLYIYQKYRANVQVTSPLNIAMSLIVPLPVINSILQAVLVIISSKEIRNYVTGKLLCCVADPA